MTAEDAYPIEPAGPFPRPPQSLTDEAGREIVVEELSPAAQGTVDALVAMYETFDPADRAQGIPPVGRREIEQWIDLILAEGLDLVARRDDSIVGHATLVPDDDGGSELAIFVHQDHRGVGIGSTLVRTLLGAAAADGIERVWLTVERWNTVAIRLYESVGFERTGGGSFELEMALRLDAQTARTG